MILLEGKNKVSHAKIKTNVLIFRAEFPINTLIDKDATDTVKSNIHVLKNLLFSILVVNIKRC